MMLIQLSILCWLICVTNSYPSKSLSSRADLTSQKTESNDQNDQNDDYVEKMADIFDIPMDDDRRINLENCENIICMPHSLCINDMIVTNGTELFEWRLSTRINVEKTDIVCDDMEMPCCADEAMKNLHQTEQNDEDSNDNSENENENTDEESETDSENTISNVVRCGYRYEGNQEKTAARIIDGDDAQPNEFPWMVGLFSRVSDDNLLYIGGGSLIHRSVILTAAHSLRRIVPEKLVIRVGEHDILDPNNDGKRQERNVTNIIIHEDLYAEALINDIALIVVDKPFELTDSVNTICIPPQSIQNDEHVMCTSSGWGKNANDRHGKYQAVLKKVELPIVSRGKCEHILRRTRLGPFYNLHSSLMCAGGGRRDTCKGDGGSPLVCEIPYEKDRFYQTGIVAGGIGCGRKVPGLYVNVSHFSDWIKHQLGFIDLDLEPENEQINEK